MKRLTLFSALFTSLLGSSLVVAQIAQAQSASTTPSAEVRRMIRERIEQTIQEKVPQTNPILGTLGTVQKVGEKTFTITDTLGRERTVELNDGAVIRQGNQTIALKDLSINSGAAVVGKLQDDIVIRAARVYVVDNAFVERRQVSIGTITEWKNNELTLSIRGTTATATWKTSAKPRLEDSLGNTITAKNIQADQSALVVTEENSSGTRTITRLRLLVPVEGAQPSPAPTPSVTPRATPSPRTSPRPTASPKTTPLP